MNANLDENFVQLSPSRHIKLKGDCSWIPASSIMNFLNRTTSNYHFNGKYYPQGGDICECYDSNGEYSTVVVLGYDNFSLADDIIVIKTGEGKYEAVLSDMLRPAEIIVGGVL